MSRGGVVPELSQRRKRLGGELETMQPSVCASRGTLYTPPPPSPLPPNKGASNRGGVRPESRISNQRASQATGTGRRDLVSPGPDGVQRRQSTAPDYPPTPRPIIFYICSLLLIIHFSLTPTAQCCQQHDGIVDHGQSLWGGLSLPGASARGRLPFCVFTLESDPGLVGTSSK
jgi:hypothetical protein